MLCVCACVCVLDFKSSMRFACCRQSIRERKKGDVHVMSCVCWRTNVCIIQPVSVGYRLVATDYVS